MKSGEFANVNFSFFVWVSGLEIVTATPDNSKGPHGPRTLTNSKLALTPTKIDFPWISFKHLL